MNGCIYCNGLTKGKVCAAKTCKNKYKAQHYSDNIEHYREIKRKERNKNFAGRKDKALQQAKDRYYSSDPKHVIGLMFQNARSRAKASSLEFSLDKSFLIDLFKTQQNKCALTNLDFKYDQDETNVTHKRPFAPSLDRIDSTKGYTKDNVRLVCIIVNFALSEFGDNSFDKMCKAYVENK